jgi:hypothetical protein
MLGDDKFEIRPMGAASSKSRRGSRSQDIKLAEQCWQTGREAIYSENTISSSSTEINYVISYKMLEAASRRSAARPARAFTSFAPATTLTQTHRARRPGAEMKVKHPTARHSRPAWYDY